MVRIRRRLGWLSKTGWMTARAGVGPGCSSSPTRPACHRHVTWPRDGFTTSRPGAQRARDPDGAGRESVEVGAEQGRGNGRLSLWAHGMAWHGPGTGEPISNAGGGRGSVWHRRARAAFMAVDSARMRMRMRMFWRRKPKEFKRPFANEVPRAKMKNSTSNCCLPRASQSRDFRQGRPSPDQPCVVGSACFCRT